MTKSKRSQTKISEDREIIKKHVLKNYLDKGFTTREIFNELNSTFNRSKHGSLCRDLRSLTKQGFLTYEIKLRKNNKGKMVKGAVFILA